MPSLNYRNEKSERKEAYLVPIPKLTLPPPVWDKWTIHIWIHGYGAPPPLSLRARGRVGDDYIKDIYTI